MEKRKLVFLFALFSPVALSMESELMASPLILIWPAVSVSITFGFILWKIKKPLSQWFSSYSDQISSMLEGAALQEKEAKIKLEAFQKKIDRIDREFKKIKENEQEEIIQFIKNQKTQTKTEIDRMQKDYQSVVEYEKHKIMQKFDEEITESLIGKVKNNFQQDLVLRRKGTAKLFSELENK